MKKVALVILILGLFFSVYPQQDSRSLTVMEMERIGDRLLATDELEQILSRATQCRYRSISFIKKTFMA